MQGGKQNMNSKSVEKSKNKNADNQAGTIILIIAKIVSNFWNLIQKKIQKFKDTICRCVNILFSKNRIRMREKIIQAKRISDKDKQQMLIMLGTMSEVGGEC